MDCGLREEEERSPKRREDEEVDGSPVSERDAMGVVRPDREEGLEAVDREAASPTLVSTVMPLPAPLNEGSGGPLHRRLLLALLRPALRAQSRLPLRRCAEGADAARLLRLHGQGGSERGAWTPDERRTTAATGRRRR